MVEEGEEIRTEVEVEEDGGGAVKSFLDHLEDLRWVLIKCGVAVLIGMVVCLAAGNSLMSILKWPLERAAHVSPGTNQFLRLQIGTNFLGTFRMATNRYGDFDFGSNQLVTFQMVPLEIGTNRVLALQSIQNAPGDILPKNPVTLLNLSPAGGFMTAFQLAIYGGLVLASPLVIFYVAQFLVPALKKKEKKYVFRGFSIGTGLFLSGVSFAYFVLMPLALNASRRYSEWLGIGADQWTAEQFISFTCKFMLGMGLGFEMPVVLLVFVKLGILDYHKLAAFRRYMIVVNLVLGAVLTTPEILTQIMMALPLQVLYEITVWIAWYWERRDKKRADALEASNGGKGSD
jgi:sec-independent protein translocase protein TatC